MEQIEDGGKLLAIVKRGEDWIPGLHFWTAPEAFIQAASWRYPAGKQLADHRHKIYERTVTRTQEVVFVKQGSMKIRIYTDHGRLVRTLILKCGDLAVMLEGGHGYEILEEDSQVLEVKNGPFIDVSVDKEAL